MSRKIETGSVRSMTPTRTVTWNKGRRTVVTSYTKTNRKTGEVSRATDTSSLNILGIVLLVLLFGTVAVILTGSNEPKTFGSFLEMLTTVPKATIPWSNIEPIGFVLPDWLSFLTPFLEFFQNLLSVGNFFIKGIYQAIYFIIWILRWVIA